ncbi:hypothetical protein C2S52_014261 [Perilla frutescens var. hirtella]|uniref:Uncharacterized protein n=1 Tax=Perilla frutescens var. hirtella TaxID=608512 RepID=A0AAD4J367_PERFH|nr:hypothetical protein C2S51_016459 [Perilla frutescens var. frutescens]KAH6776700.1 hypothetical protein C2S52_014261 [Perilla frutescens var. hirtella]KAH6826252.1 hypothetical protein C2S53_001689 [Perilla frutescens var. hirtella]
MYSTSSSTQTIPPKAFLHSQNSCLAPFSAVAPPQYIQVSRLHLDTTLDTIIEEPTADDYSSIEESVPSDGGGKQLQETSELVLEMAKCCYRVCFLEVKEMKAMPSLTF